MIKFDDPRTQFIEKPTNIVIHHGDCDITWTEKNIRELHTRVNKWDDIGYHAVILYPFKGALPEYLIRRGRDEQWQGAHCLGFNHASLGVCLIGKWEVLQPHPMQLEALTLVLKEWMQKYNITKERIWGHRDKFATVCPGDFLYDWLTGFKDSLVEVQ